MSSLSFLFICIQACLVQNVFSQSFGSYPYGPAPTAASGLAPYNYGAGLAPAPFGVAPMAVELGGLGAGCAPAHIELGAYGGAGVGDVAVAGEIPVTGTTLVTGQVPILGAVRFSGDLPACGKVTVSGSCGCGCNRGPNYY